MASKKIEAGFEKADSDNLPHMDVEMINSFYMDNLQFFSSETRNEKSKRASKEAYGDNAVSYVQLRRDGHTCKVQCKITPEHKIHKTAYNVAVVVNEQEEKVLSCDCTGCAASSGGCKHSIAFLFWLHRRSEEPSVTSQECYWKASKLSKVGAIQKYMSLGQLTGKPTILTQAKDEQIVNCLIARVGVQEGGVFDLYKSSPLKIFDLYQILLRYKTEVDATSYSADHFISFARRTIRSGNILQVEKVTIEQSLSTEWYEMRFGRITASKVYEAAHCTTPEGALMESIMGASKTVETGSILRGNRLEPAVLQQVEKLKKIKINKVGLLLNEEFPVLGASPDGISDEFCIEVKCPSKAKTIENYWKNEVINEKYYFQLQMQMLFASKNKGLFCIASPNFEEDKEVKIIEVEFKENEIREVIELSLSFWKNYVFSKLIAI